MTDIIHFYAQRNYGMICFAYNIAKLESFYAISNIEKNQSVLMKTSILCPSSRVDLRIAHIFKVWLAFIT